MSNKKVSRLYCPIQNVTFLTNYYNYSFITVLMNTRSSIV